MEIISLSYQRVLLRTHPDTNILAQQKQNKVEIKITLPVAWVILSFHPTGISLGLSVKERDRSAIPSVSLCCYGFLECEHLVPLSVFLIFIDFDYHTTRPPNASQLFLLVFNLRNQIWCWRKTGCVGLNGRWFVRLHCGTLLWDVQGEFWLLSSLILHADFRS